jgi:hypothetical protein
MRERSRPYGFHGAAAAGIQPARLLNSGYKHACV